MWIQVDFLKRTVSRSLQCFGDNHEFSFQGIRILSIHCFLGAHCRADNGREAGENFNLPQVEYPLDNIVYSWNHEEHVLHSDGIFQRWIDQFPVVNNQVDIGQNGSGPT